jgi:antitoxin component YwqK of YwqJK toxin-antitoxin module
MLTGFFFVKSQRLSSELTESKSNAAMALQQMKDEVAIQRIDSLLMRGNYSKALKAYQQALNSDSSSKWGEIEMRIDLTRQLISLENQVRQAAAMQDDSAKMDTLQVTITATPTEIRAYDSLRFELEKKQVELEHLRNSLGNRSAGTYITFKSRKGNHIHYVGEVQDGKANGQGIALLNTGSRYVGQWKDNMRHGEGTFYWPDGEYYEGNYHNDIRHGQGTYYWPSGEKYIGEWRNDKRNGEGVFYGEDGDIVARGTWKNDELVNVEKSEGRN